MGLPMFFVSVSANSAARARRSSATFCSAWPRSRCMVLPHGPSSNASRAAFTASATSSPPASGTCAITLPVAGLTTSISLPLFAGTHSPLIHIFFASAMARLLRLSVCTVHFVCRFHIVTHFAPFDLHAALHELGEERLRRDRLFRGQHAARADVTAREHLHHDRRRAARVD